MMATTSVGGPPVLLYLLSGNDPPQVNRANIVTYYFLTQFLLIVIVLATGVAGFDALARAVVLFPVMVLGAWAGGRAVPRPGQRAALPQRGARHPVRHRPVRPAAQLAVRLGRQLTQPEVVCGNSLQPDRHPVGVTMGVTVPSGFPKQAIVVIHGMGEQKPMDTIRICPCRMDGRTEGPREWPA